MAAIPPAAHAQILGAIRDARADVVALRKATKLETGYIGFDLVETTLANCHAAIAVERDQARVIMMLKTAVAAITTYGGGEVAPAVQRTNKTLTDILQELEARDSKNR